MKMNNSRIEVPLSLPEPHFEDEATVVTARQVVPLEEARVQDRRRKLFAILPILLAATLCGGLGAVAVNYFGQRSSIPAISPPATSFSPQERQVTAAASPDNGAAASTGLRDEPDTSQPSGSVLASDSTAAADSLEKSEAVRTDETVASAKKPSASTDPKQLVRPRRVHPPSVQPRSGQNDQQKSRGAARIQNIFSGPNP
jgi:hypothetical protein